MGRRESPDPNSGAPDPPAARRRANPDRRPVLCNVPFCRHPALPPHRRNRPAQARARATPRWPHPDRWRGLKSPRTARDHDPTEPRCLAAGLPAGEVPDHPVQPPAPAREGRREVQPHPRCHAAHVRLHVCGEVPFARRGGAPSRQLRSDHPQTLPRLEKCGRGGSVFRHPAPAPRGSGGGDYSPPSTVGSGCEC